MTKPLTCRKINALIEDEAMAHKEYHDFAEQSKSKLMTDHFYEMSQDEQKHKYYLEQMRITQNCLK